MVSLDSSVPWGKEFHCGVREYFQELEGFMDFFWYGFLIWTAAFLLEATRVVPWAMLAGVQIAVSRNSFQFSLLFSLTEKEPQPPTKILKNYQWKVGKV